MRNQQEFNEYVAFRLLDGILNDIDMGLKGTVEEQLKKDIIELHKRMKNGINYKTNQ